MINGSNYTIGDGVNSGNGLHFVPGSDNSTVQGLVINQWISSGILIDNSSGIGLSGIKVTECFIGTDATGTQQQANRTGIGLSGTSDATIDSNVIAGSFSWFLVDNYNISGAGIFSNASMGTTITNNTIGTDITGCMHWAIHPLESTCEVTKMELLLTILYQDIAFLVSAFSSK